MNRENALLLRLLACELTNETRGIVVLRRILHDLGWTDAQIDAARTRVRAVLWVQAELFERAA
jgi:hypothetical protein